MERAKVTKTRVTRVMNRRARVDHQRDKQAFTPELVPVATRLARLCGSK